MYVVKDEPGGVYRYLYVDPDPSTVPDFSTEQSKYKDIVFVDDLKKRPERVIHVGSMFGVSRVRDYLPEHKRIRKFIERQFVFSHPRLVRAVDEVVDKLGGPRQFLSMHLRVGDSFFAEIEEVTKSVSSIVFKKVPSSHQPPIPTPDSPRVPRHSKKPLP